MGYHLAQVNVARMKGVSIDDPEMIDFRNHTDAINELAESSPGFLWRDAFDPDAAPQLNVLQDEQVIINFSVWKDVLPLKEFTYKTVHAAIMKRQKEWFQNYGKAHYALWWIEVGAIPTEKEAIDRLDYLQEHGASERAFTFREVFDKPGD